MLSRTAVSVWAKSERGDVAWLPLYQHLADAAVVAGHLWDDWLAPSVRGLIADQLPQGGDDARVLLTWLAGVHDIGKATPSFALQRQDLTGRMRDAGLNVPFQLPDGRLLLHAPAGQHLLVRWMVARQGFRRREASAFAVVVGGHMGAPPDHDPRGLARDHPYLVGDGLWVDVQNELLEHMALATGAAERLKDWRAVRLSPTAQALLTGIVIMADWLASDVTNFPYGDSRSSTERAADAWGRLDLPPRWVPASPADVNQQFVDRFALHNPHPVQGLMVQVAREISAPPLLVLEAPMGYGKTEAALAAAEVLAERFGCGGVFVALPTMATSDAMFDRVLTWVESLPASPGVGTGTLHLAHGRARLNEKFNGLVGIGRLHGIGQDDTDTGAAPHLLAVANSWLTGRKKGPLATFVVGTIDQVLFGALKHKHLVLRHLALAGKVVVIDEVHAADEYMRVYLHRVLQWLGAYGVPTIVLSATLPSAQRRQLVEAYDVGRRTSQPTAAPAADYTVLQGNVGYPVVTAATGARPQVHAMTGSAPSRIVRLERLSDDDAALVTTLQHALANGGCVAVVRNTVGRAQETARLLLQHFSADEVELLHSRFVATDRIERETRLRGRLGPVDVAGSRRPHRLIVVGTQVIEQSLDVDFDMMVTDLAPVDLVLQRIGRLHRHDRGWRPAGVSKARCLVAGVEDWAAEPPRPVTGSKAVYGLSRLLRSAAVLSPYWNGDLTLPQHIPALVEAAYAGDVAAPAGWEQAMTRADADAQRRTTERVARASTFLLKEPDCPPDGSLVGSMHGGVGEAGDDGGAGQAQVRDAEDSIEAVVVQRMDDEIRMLPWLPVHGGAAVATSHAPPSWQLARAVAACTIRLPSFLSRGARGDQVVSALEDNWFDGWQHSPWLSGQLVLVLDAELSACLADHHLQYDRDRGLLVTKKSS